MTGFRGARWLLVVLLGAGPAYASSTFPGELKEQLGLSQVPLCTVCHTDLKGGSDTLAQPFGLAVQTHGAVSNDTQSLRQAIAAMEKDRTDSDEDGISDIEELEAGSNPNRPGNEGSPTYGCNTAYPGVFSALSLLWWAVQRRTRARLASL